MLLDRLFHDEREKHPKKLIFRFLIAISILFVFFINMAFFIMVRTSEKNLYNFYRQEYLKILAVVENNLINTKDYMKAFAELPQLKEHYERLISYHNEAGDMPVPPLESLPLFRERIPIKFITIDGVIFASSRIEELYTDFQFSDELRQAEKDTNGFGWFLAKWKNDTDLNNIIYEPTLYFFLDVKNDAGDDIGNIIFEKRIELVPSPSPDTGISESDSENVYSLFKLVDQFVIDENGKPITPVRFENEYIAELRSDGIFLYYQDIPVVNAGRIARPVENITKSNIKLINELISRKPEELYGFGRTYRNYLNTRVRGAGFWIKELNIGVVLEISSFEAFAPYLTSLTLIFVILAVSFTIFLYLIYWVNSLRIKALDANPLTKLPGNNIINEKIQAVLDEDVKAAIVYCDLDNFKAFNDTYGFSRGDDVIQFTADVLRKAVYSFPSKHTFCGHIGGDDFIFIVMSDYVNEVSDNICKNFDDGIKDFYSKKHLEQGCIEAEDRQGSVHKFPIMSLSMAGIFTENNKMKHYLEVSGRCGELKKFAKQKPGSLLFLDRRSG